MARREEAPKSKDPLAVAFGERVTALLKEHELAPKLVAERCDMTVAYLWRVQDGRQNISLRNLGRLASAFGLTLAQLMECVRLPADTGGRRGYVYHPNSDTDRPADGE